MMDSDIVNKINCTLCKFFFKKKVGLVSKQYNYKTNQYEEIIFGECRLYPPKPFGQGSDFPIVSENIFCHQFIKKKGNNK